MVSAFNILLVTMKILVSCPIHARRFKADVTALILQTFSAATRICRKYCDHLGLRLEPSIRIQREGRKQTPGANQGPIIPSFGMQDLLHLHREEGFDKLICLCSDS